MPEAVTQTLVVARDGGVAVAGMVLAAIVGIYVVKLLLRAITMPRF